MLSLNGTVYQISDTDHDSTKPVNFSSRAPPPVNLQYVCSSKCCLLCVTQPSLRNTNLFRDDMEDLSLLLFSVADVNGTVSTSIALHAVVDRLMGNLRRQTTCTVRQASTRGLSTRLCRS